MGDLNDLQAAQSVKIIGATATGQENTPVNATLLGGMHINVRDSAGNEMLGQKTMAASIPMVLASDQSLAFDLVVNGTIIANGGAVQADGLGQPYTLYTAELAGTYSIGTQIAFEQSTNGTNWYTSYNLLIDTAAASPNNSYLGGGTGRVVVRGLISGMRYVRAHALTFQVGDSVTVKITLSSAEGPSILAAALPSGNNNIGDVDSNLRDGSGNLITSTTINSKQRLDVNAATDAVDGAAAPFQTSQVGGKDASGNIQAMKVAVSGEQFVKDVIDVAGQNRAQSVTTSAAEALGAATILANRKFISIRPTNGIIYWGFTSGVTTTTGTPIYTNEVFTISASDNVHIYLIAAQTTDVRISEGS